MQHRSGDGSQFDRPRTSRPLLSRSATSPRLGASTPRSPFAKAAIAFSPRGVSLSPKAVASEDAWQQYGGASANGGASVKETAAKKSLTRPPVARRCRATSEFASKQLREKTPKQLRELHEDLRSDMATLRAVVRRREGEVEQHEREKQLKFAELSKASGGAVLQWLLLKSEANFPEKIDALIEKARDELQDALTGVSELEGKITALQEITSQRHTTPVEQRPLFVHFIPPPMRVSGKGHLPWIVHSSQAGCREARHVHFHSLSGFETYEGSPPEQAEGKTCGCHIANHHLRGFGTVRWDGDDAIIENELHDGQHGQQVSDAKSAKSCGGGSDVDARDSQPPMINGMAYRELSRRQAMHLAQAQEEIRRLRSIRSDYFKNREEERHASLESMKGLQDALELIKDKYKQLSYEHQILQVQYKAQGEEWARAFAGVVKPTGGTNPGAPIDSVTDHCVDAGAYCELSS